MRPSNGFVFVAFLVIVTWNFWTHITTPDRWHMARFGVAYANAREALDYYSRCSPVSGGHFGPSDERPAVQRAFVDLRRSADKGGYTELVQIKDLEQQVLSEDAHGVVQDRQICVRLGDRGVRTAAEVGAAIATARSLAQTGGIK